MGQRKRNNKFLIYLTDDEKKILDYKYEKSGLRSRNDFMRQLVLYGFVYKVDYSELKQFNWTLANISNNINQIAHNTNITGQVTRDEFKEVKEEMNKVWQLQKSILSNLRFNDQ